MKTKEVYKYGNLYLKLSKKSLIIFWTWREALSKLKLPSKLVVEHIERKLKSFDLKFHVSFCIHF